MSAYVELVCRKSVSKVENKLSALSFRKLYCIPQVFCLHPVFRKIPKVDISHSTLRIVFSPVRIWGGVAVIRGR